ARVLDAVPIQVVELDAGDRGDADVAEVGPGRQGLTAGDADAAEPASGRDGGHEADLLLLAENIRATERVVRVAEDHVRADAVGHARTVHDIAGVEGVGAVGGGGRERLAGVADAVVVAVDVNDEAAQARLAGVGDAVGV